MSTGCRSTIGPFNHDPDRYTLVDFDLTVEGLCPNSRYAIVAELLANGDRAALVDSIFDVPNRRCSGGCTEATLSFTNVIADLGDMNNCTDDITWELNILHENYISRGTSE